MGLQSTDSDILANTAHWATMGTVESIKDIISFDYTKSGVWSFLKPQEGM